MMATRTLAVSSALGAMFLLHGCGDKKEEKPQNPPSNTDTNNTEGGNGAAGAADGDSVPAPASTLGGNWGDVANYIKEKKMTGKSMTDKEFVKFRAEFEEQVEKNTSTDEIFDSSAAHNTISVVLNDWNVKQMGCESNSEAFAKAFYNEKKERDYLDVNVNDFGKFHELVEERGNTYVADPAQIDCSRESKWTKAVFFALDQDDNDVWIRGDDDDKKKAKVTKEQLRPMNMVVVFNGKEFTSYPFQNRNNFAMAVVNPKDTSSPLDVFKASLKTFSIVFKVMSAAKQMQDGQHDKYKFADNYKDYTVSTAQNELKPLNWWGAYSDHEGSTRSEVVETKLVGGQCPEFGKVTRDESRAIELLQNISKEIKKFFNLQEKIIKGGSTMTLQKMAKLGDQNGDNSDVVKNRNKNEKNKKVMTQEDSIYMGACLKRDVAAWMQDKTLDAKHQKEVQDWFDTICQPHPEHINSLYWRIRNAASKVNDLEFKFRNKHCAEDDTECLQEAQTLAKNSNMFASKEMKMIRHSVLYAEYPQYAAQVHDVQTAIMEFYQDYKDEEIGDRYTHDSEYTLQGKEHQLYKLGDKFFKKAQLEKCVIQGLKKQFEVPKKKKFGNVDLEYGEFRVFTDDLKPADGEITTATFWAAGDSCTDGDEAFFGALIENHDTKEIQIWDDLFKFLGQYSRDDISKFVPQDKTQWLNSYHKMEVDDDLKAEWFKYKFPSERTLSTAEVKRIFVGPQSNQAEINAAVYAGLTLQFFDNFGEGSQNANFYLAVSDPKKARGKSSMIKDGQLEMTGAEVKNMPKIVLAGSQWSSATKMVDDMFKPPKKQQDGKMDAGF